MGYKKSIVVLSCSVNNFVVIFDQYIVAYLFDIIHYKSMIVPRSNMGDRIEVLKGDSHYKLILFLTVSILSQVVRVSATPSSQEPKHLQSRFHSSS